MTARGLKCNSIFKLFFAVVYYNLLAWLQTVVWPRSLNTLIHNVDATSLIWKLLYLTIPSITKSVTSFQNHRHINHHHHHLAAMCLLWTAGVIEVYTVFIWRLWWRMALRLNTEVCTAAFLQPSSSILRSYRNTQVIILLRLSMPADIDRGKCCWGWWLWSRYLCLDN